MKQALVSIITPVYNAQAFLADTIQSVIKQTYPHWELILVDDASSDGSVALIKSFQEKDDRIRLIALEVNSGAAVARNTGIDQAKGQFIAFIDADDMWLEDKLAKQIAFMSQNAYAFTYTGLAFVDQDGQVLKSLAQVPLSLDYHGLLKNTAIACSTVVIDRAKVGDFHMPLVRRGQDTATWLMLLRTKVDRAYGLQEVLNHYRQVEGSISSNRWTALKRTWNTYRNLEKLPLHKASYYFILYVINAIRRRT